MTLESVNEWLLENASLIEGAVTAWFVLLAAVAIVSGLYIRWVYLHRREDAPFLTRMFFRDRRDWLATILLLVLVWLAINRMVSRPWGTVIICTSVTVYMYGLIDDAFTFFRERRDQGKNGGE